MTSAQFQREAEDIAQVCERSFELTTDETVPVVLAINALTRAVLLCAQRLAEG